MKTSKIVKSLEVQTRDGGWFEIDHWEDGDVTLALHEAIAELSQVTLQEDEARELIVALGGTPPAAEPEEDYGPEWW